MSVISSTSSLGTDASMGETDTAAHWAKLATACVAGDRSARKRVVLHVYDLVFATVSYAVHDRALVDDVVQDVLIEVLSSMRLFRGECSLFTWARKIAVRVCTRRLQQQKRHNRVLLFADDCEWRVPATDGAMPETQLRQMLNQLVAQLPVKQQMVIRLRYVHELKIAEIAQVVEAPEETVRDRIKRGRQKLRRMIEKNRDFHVFLTKEMDRHDG